MVVKMFQEPHCYSVNKLHDTKQSRCYREIFIDIQDLNETVKLSNFHFVTYVFMVIVWPIAERLLVTIATLREF